MRGSSKSSVMREWYQSCSHALTGSTLRTGSIVALTAAMAESYPGCGGKSPEAGKSSMRLEVRWDLSSGGMKGARGSMLDGSRTRGCCTRGTSAARDFILGERRTSLLPVCVLEARLGGSLWCQQKRTCIFMTRKGSNGIWSLTLESILMRRWSMSRSRGGLRDRLPRRLIAIHLPTEQRRVKPHYEVYRPAGSKGVQTCGPKGDKSAIKRGKSQKKTKKTSKSRLQVGEVGDLLDECANRANDSMGSIGHHALSMAD